MKIALGCDHAGFNFKIEIVKWLKESGHQVLDFGAFSTDSIDYPDYAFPASEAVASGVANFGVLICGTGTGMAITANKVTGIRAANCCSVQMAEMARSHNNANIIAFGARLVSVELALEMLKKFLTTDFDGGRHMIRIEKIHALTGL
jgi:ribose 5-phosphate isomerase B